MIYGKYIVIFFNRTDNFNCQVLPQRTWPSRFQSLLPIFLFYWLKWSRIYSRKLKKIFFSRRQDTPEYSQVFILQKLGFRLYIIFTYFFLYLYPWRLYVINLAASGVTSPLVGLKPIVGVVQDSNSRHEYSLNIFRQRLASAQVQVCDDDSLYWHRFNNPQSETGDNM